MTIQDVVKTVRNMVLKPDESAALADGLITALEGDYAAAASSIAKIAEQEEKIKTLQEQNLQLFLRVTGDPGTQQPEEKTDKEKAEEFIASFAKEEGV